MMKAVVVIACVLAINIATSASEDIMENTRKWTGLPDSEIESCFESTTITLEDMQNFEAMAGEDNNKEDMEEKMKQFGCWIACLYHKTDLMKGNELQVDNINKMADTWAEHMKDGSTDKIDKCLGQVKDIDDECDVALVFSTCLVNPMQKE